MTTKIKFTSPFGVARYPHISSPDTKGKYADNKWKTSLVYPINTDTLKMVDEIKDAAKTLGKSEKMYVPVTVDEEAGEIVIIAKSVYAPAIFDAKGKAAKGVNIGGGSVLRLMGNIVGYDKGVTIQLNQVQIKELNGFGTCAFGAVEDGYEYSAEDAVASSFADSGNEGAETNGSALDI